MKLINCIVLFALIILSVLISAQENNTFEKYVPEINEWIGSELIESVINIADSKLVTLVKTYKKEESSITFTLSCGKKDLVTAGNNIDLSDCEKIIFNGFEAYKFQINGTGSIYLKILEKDDLKGEILIAYFRIGDATIEELLNEFNFKGMYLELVKLFK